jgi:hypothetical protein
MDHTEERWIRLLEIASEELAVRTFEESGKATNDVRLVRISSVARALERAYDLGLLMGFAVREARVPETARSEADCPAEEEKVCAVVRNISDYALR